MNNQETRDYYEKNPSACWVALILVCLGYFLTPLGLSAVMVAVPAISSDLKASAVLVSWIPTSFMLANVIFLLPFGRFADLYGRKLSYLLGTLVLSVGCLLAGLASNIEWLLFFRVLQGVGTALTFSSGSAIVFAVFPMRRRGLAMGLTAGAVSLGLSCGPLFGGFITEYLGWRSVFFLQVPITLVVIVLMMWKLKGEWKSDAKEPFDWTGSVLFGTCSSAIFIGISGLPDTLHVVILGAGIALLLLFVKHQGSIEYPLIRLKALWRNRLFSYSVLSSLVIGTGSFPVVFLVSLYLQFIRDMTPAEAGQLMMIQAIAMALAAMLSGRLSDLYQPRKLAVTGCVIAVIGFAIIQGIDTSTGMVRIVVGLILIGGGSGLFLTPNNYTAMSVVQESRLGIASALMSLSRTMGNMLGSVLVLLSISLTMGSAKITPDQYQGLLTVIHWCLGVSCACAVLAVYWSFLGKVKSEAKS